MIFFEDLVTITIHVPASIPGFIRGFRSRYERRQQEQHQSTENLIKNQAGRLYPRGGTTDVSLSFSQSHTCTYIYIHTQEEMAHTSIRHENTLQCIQYSHIHICTDHRVAGSKTAERFDNAVNKEENCVLFPTNSSQLAVTPN